jgi:hypothetical protein
MTQATSYQIISKTTSVEHGNQTTRGKNKKCVTNNKVINMKTMLIGLMVYSTNPTKGKQIKTQKQDLGLRAHEPCFQKVQERTRQRLAGIYGKE